MKHECFFRCASNGALHATTTKSFSLT